MARLPSVAGDSATWGTVLNEFLSVSHEADGTIKGTSASLQTYWQSGDSNWNAAFTRMSADSTITEIYVPPSDTPYDVSSTVTLPRRMSLHIADGATIRATSTIAGPVIATETALLGQQWRDKAIRGGIIDCNNLAQNGLSVPYGFNSIVADLTVKNATSHGAIFGDTAAPSPSNELKVQGIKIDRADAGAVPAGSYGIWVRNAYDSSFTGCISVGAEACFRNDCNMNKFIDCHGWGYVGHLPTTIFDDNGDQAMYVACEADTATTYGWRVRKLRCHISNSAYYHNTIGNDNVVEAVHYDQQQPLSTIHGLDIKGEDASHRLARDSNRSLPAGDFSGVKTTNVVTTLLRNAVTVDDLPTSNISIAHRAGGDGASIGGYAPENGMAAIELAMVHGAHIIDLDVEKTQDGVFVLMHDASVDRTTTSTGNIDTYPSHLLPQIDMRDEYGVGWPLESVPTLEQVFQRFGGKIVLSLECKNGVGDIPAVCDMIKKYGLQRSVIINSASNTDISTVTSNGCLGMMYDCTTTTEITQAETAGAWMVAAPYNVSSTVVNAALASATIKRVVTNAISRRVHRDAKTAGFQGWHSDAGAYLSRVDARTTVAQEITASKVGMGWLRSTNTATAYPIFSTSPAGLYLAKASIANSYRNYMLGSLSGPKAGTYTITYVITFPAFVGDTTTRPQLRACCPSDEGNSQDADSRGYLFTCRKSGQLQMWESAVGYGAPTSLGTAASTAVGDGGGDVTIRFEVTPTTVKLVRVDDATALGPFTNSAWRGDYLWVGWGNTSQDFVLKSVTIA